jgi:hypothetical protein
MNSWQQQQPVDPNSIRHRLMTLVHAVRTLLRSALLTVLFADILFRSSADCHQHHNHHLRTYCRLSNKSIEAIFDHLLR